MLSCCPQSIPDLDARDDWRISLRLYGNKGPGTVTMLSNESWVSPPLRSCLPQLSDLDIPMEKFFLSFSLSFLFIHVIWALFSVSTSTLEIVGKKTWFEMEFAMADSCDSLRRDERQERKKSLFFSLSLPIFPTLCACHARAPNAFEIREN